MGFDADEGSVTYPRTDGSEIDADVLRAAGILGVDSRTLGDYADVRFLSDENLALIPYSAIRHDLIAATALITQLEALLSSPDVVRDPRLAGPIIEALRRARLAAASHRALAGRKAWAEEHLFDKSTSQFLYAMPASAARSALDEVLEQQQHGRTSSTFRALVEKLGMEGGSCYVGWMIGKPLDAQSLMSFTGRNTFNGFYFDDDIRTIQVLEAKGGGAHLGYASGLRQGTNAYFELILSKMSASPDARRRDQANALKRAYTQGYEVRYVGVRTAYAADAPEPRRLFDNRVVLQL
jgi:hypothetical protein